MIKAYNAGLHSSLVFGHYLQSVMINLGFQNIRNLLRQFSIRAIDSWRRLNKENTQTQGTFSIILFTSIDEKIWKTFQNSRQIPPEILYRQPLNRTGSHSSHRYGGTFVEMSLETPESREPQLWVEFVVLPPDWPNQ